MKIYDIEIEDNFIRWLEKLINIDYESISNYIAFMEKERIMTLINFYEEFKRYNGRSRYFLQSLEYKDHKGYLCIDKIPHIHNQRQHGTGYHALGYIILPDGNMYFLKRMSSSEDEIQMYNNIVVPQIAKQFGVEAAEYIICTKGNELYLLSPSFLKENENIVYGTDMFDLAKYPDMDIMDMEVGDFEDLDINSSLIDIESYLLARNVSKDEIEGIQEKFLQQCFLNKFIEQSDEKPENTGIIKEENGTFRMAPLWDTDYSTMVPDYGIKRWVNRDESKNDLLSFVTHFFNYKNFGEYMQRIAKLFNVKKAIEEAEAASGIEIPERIRQRYFDYFNQRLGVLESSISKIKEKSDFGWNR